MLRISLGLASVTLSILFAAQALGLVPDRRAAVLDGRKALCEAVAIRCSYAAQQTDFVAVQAELTALVRRNPDIISAAVRTRQGRTVVQVGDHPTAADESPDAPS